ncbi:hypothetical protein C5B85_14615 [Pseudoclavibacter sp. AY1F1]|uniref:hypothetical protein n=1 Tax=Pseudoclavibacter sp. AY1F1 TaxID=2080583 RepID=UPI000CE7DEA1|nr:hypothetical protein [Pseudoclavibacter sp. AY1F1]PPF43177.1 hypothetical protein C5B85_14615 [Pseudoclavibacter sp. AY1F1]
MALSGGGGGGWSGGGGGSLSRITSWTGPNPDTYDGRYDIGSTGGGGSSHTNGAFTNLTAVSDTRAVNTGGNGNNGYVRVTFYRC